ncbi:hypothetical protein MJO28_013302 [Puccinia striiformis f. sp. tritici]|nr:hypothetical protein MJO28_013302 [Puccinia striiformis f. sp. tritici]
MNDNKLIDDNVCSGSEDQEKEDDGYSSYSREQLINQIKVLKTELVQQEQQHKLNGNGNKNLEDESTKKKKKKELDFNQYSTRKIALTISYQGGSHGGLAWQPEITPLSTVEGELFRALLVSRLVEGSELSPVGQSAVDYDDNEKQEWRGLVDINKWGYSRAGRTDAGVSGSGQVVSLWLRSRKKAVDGTCGFLQSKNNTPASPSEEDKEEKEEEELAYHTILNSILPDSVRVLAWSPVHADFDARFSCSARHYKYFFSLYESPSSPALDIEAMRLAAGRLVGEHDFRNFCRIDPSKQLDNFHRRIISAEINPVDNLPTSSPPVLSPVEQGNTTRPAVYPESLSPQTNRLFVFDLVGTAFLYNMVRHIVSVLFLVGSGHEKPTVVDQLLYTDPSKPIPPSLISASKNVDAIECKPEYSHASPLPLLLYRCIYPEASFQWVSTPIGTARPISGEPFVVWIQARIRAQLSYHLIDCPRILQSKPPSSKSLPLLQPRFVHPLGAASGRASATYIPLVDRPRAPHFSVVNSNWWNKVGAKRLAKRQLL